MIKFKGYNYTNNGYYEKYYEEKAAEGYFIKKIYFGLIHVFTKDVPKKLIYKFEYHNNNSILDEYDKQEREDFIEQSKNYGWQHVYKTFNYHLFYSENTEELKPLSIDNEIEKDGIRRSSKSNILSLFLYSICIISEIIIRKNDNIINSDIPFSNQAVFLKNIYLLLWSLIVTKALDEVIFYFKNKNNFAIYGQELEYCKPIISTIFNVLKILAILSFIVWFLFIK